MSRLSQCLYALNDERADDLLKSSRGNDPNAAGDLYEYFVQQLRDYETSRLFPGQKPEAGSNPKRTLGVVQDEWERLQENILGAAERLWRDNFLQDDDPKRAGNDRVAIANARRRLLGDSRLGKNAAAATIARAEFYRLDLLARQAHELLLLSLEANFYRQRAISNFVVYSNFGGQQDTGEEKRKAITQIYQQRYWSILKRWRSDIRLVLGRNARKEFFDAFVGTAARFKTLSEEFGPSGVQNGELGWSTYATVIGNEFRYRYFDELLKEQRADPHTFLQALFLTLLLKYLAGYALRPGYFAMVVGGFIAAYTLFYYASDAARSNACQLATPQYNASLDWQHPMTILQSLGEHLYIALTNLTSLGANPTPCGPFAHLLLSTEPLFGYFFLAVLATLLIEFLRER
jgi:hypothetical protein